MSSPFLPFAESAALRLDLNRHKVESAVWIHNYRQFRRPAYLTYAHASIQQALRAYRQLKEQSHV